MSNVGKSSSAIYLCHWTLRSPRRTPLSFAPEMLRPNTWGPAAGLYCQRWVSSIFWALRGKNKWWNRYSSIKLQATGPEWLGRLEVGHAGMYVTGLWEVDRLDCLRWGKEPEDHPAVMALSGRSVATDGGDRKQKWQRFTKPCKTKGCMKPSCVNGMVGTIRGTVAHGICQYLQHSSMPRNWPLPSLAQEIYSSDSSNVPEAIRNATCLTKLRLGCLSPFFGAFAPVQGRA